jgi:hypothetical protein
MEKVYNTMKHSMKYYDTMCGNYCIPTKEYTEEIEQEVKEFLKANRDYFLMYLSADDGYEEDMWCITNWLE